MCVRGNQIRDFVSESTWAFTQGWRINSQELSYLFRKKKCCTHSVSKETFWTELQLAASIPGWASCPEFALLRGSCKNLWSWHVPGYEGPRLVSSPWISFDNEEHIRIEWWPHSLTMPRCPILSSPGQLNNQHPRTSSGASIRRELSFLKTHTALFSRASN